MMRIRVIGLCLVAVFATSALASGSAFGAAELGRCVKVAAGSGKYADANCQKTGAPKEYNWVKNAIKKKFTATGGEGVLETQAGTKVVCTTSTATGEYKEKGAKPSTKEVKNVNVKFNGCSIPILGAACNSAGKAAGEITTNKLMGAFGIISGENTPAVVVGERLTPEVKKGAFAEFDCGAGTVKIVVKEGAGKGGNCIIAPFAEVNVMTTSVEQTYTGEPGGKQIPDHFQKTPTKICNLESNANGGPFERATQTIKATIVSEEPLEIKVKT